jgi:hypothetical protein
MGYIVASMLIQIVFILMDFLCLVDNKNEKYLGFRVALLTLSVIFLIQVGL